MRSSAIIVTLLFFLILAPVKAFGQGSFSATNIQQILSTSVSPENPGPNTDVTIKIESFSFNLNQSGITWLVDGKKVKEGVGMTRFTFKTGESGSATVVEVAISPSGDVPFFTKNFYFYPSDLDLIWQAKTYTPPFYKGRSYPSEEAILTFVAAPRFLDNGKLISPDALSYKWKRGETVLGSKSGRGQQSLTFKASYLGLDEKVSVEVSTPDGKKKAVATVSLSPQKPLVLAYENSPLYGIFWNNAINDNFGLKEKEISFTAVPYFFSGNGEPDHLIYSWTLNGVHVDSAGEDTITLRNENESVGKSLLGIEITNTKERFQKASSNFAVNFRK